MSPFLLFFAQSNYIKINLTSVWGVKAPAKVMYADTQIRYYQIPTLFLQEKEEI